jgi:hypothetical protein
MLFPIFNSGMLFGILSTIPRKTERKSILIMKTIVLALALMFSATALFAQSVKKVDVPEVKENKFVDEALDEAIAQNKLPKGSCLLLFVYTVDDNFFINITGINTKVKPIDLATTKADYAYIFNPANNLRYFNYKGYKAFVIGADDPYNSFVQTDKSKQFTFVSSYSARSSYAETSMWEKKIYINFYKFDKGRIIAKNLSDDLD